MVLEGARLQAPAAPLNDLMRVGLDAAPTGRDRFVPPGAELARLDGAGAAWRVATEGSGLSRAIASRP